MTRPSPRPPRWITPYPKGPVAPVQSQQPELGWGDILSRKRWSSVKWLTCHYGLRVVRRSQQGPKSPPARTAKEYSRNPLSSMPNRCFAQSLERLATIRRRSASRSRLNIQRRGPIELHCDRNGTAKKRWRGWWAAGILDLYSMVIAVLRSAVGLKGGSYKVHRSPTCRFNVDLRIQHGRIGRHRVDVMRPANEGSGVVDDHLLHFSGSRNVDRLRRRRRRQLTFGRNGRGLRRTVDCGKHVPAQKDSQFSRNAALVLECHKKIVAGYAVFRHYFDPRREFQTSLRILRLTFESVQP